MDEHGTILVRKRLYRAQVMAFIAQLPPTLIGMEGIVNLTRKNCTYVQ
jgi:hypothetical protein